MDAVCALHDCALGISPVTSYWGVKGIYNCYSAELSHGMIYQGPLEAACTSAGVQGIPDHDQEKLR